MVKEGYDAVGERSGRGGGVGVRMNKQNVGNLEKVVRRFVWEN